MNKILITGANGLIGREVIKELYYRYPTEFIKATDIRPNSTPPITKLDITDIDALVAAMHDIDVVIHLAALVGGKPSEKKPYEYNLVNFMGTLNVLEAMRHKNVKKMVFASSWGTYGSDISLPIDESTPQNPKNPYGISKLYAEGLVKLYTQLYGIEAIVLRPTMIYGPRQTEKIHVQQILDCMESGEVFEIWGKGTHTRELLYVDDMAKIITKCIGLSPPDGFNDYVVGTENPLSVVDVTKIAQELSYFDVTFVPSNKWVFDQRSDMTKIKTELGIDPTQFVGIEEGLRRCLKYRKQNT